MKWIDGLKDFNQTKKLDCTKKKEKKAYIIVKW